MRARRDIDVTTFRQQGRLGLVSLSQQGRRIPNGNRLFSSKRDLTGLSKREALRLAKTLLPRAKAGDLEAATMLVDAAIYAGCTGAAEHLQFALRGQSYPSGNKLSSEAAARNLKAVLEGTVTLSLFPPRRGPCMPANNIEPPLS